MDGPPIYHLALPVDWDVAGAEYRMSTRGRTLGEVGYIHCARADQVVGVANAFYGDVDEVIVLEIDPAAVDAEVVHEPPAPGAPVADGTFPHVYGPIGRAAVTAARRWRRGGAWADPPL